MSVVDYALPGRDGTAFPVRGWGNLPIELAALLAGAKPVIHCWIQEPDLAYLGALCSAFGLKHHAFARQDSGPGPARLSVMLGRDEARLRRAAAAWQSPETNPGEELGYPPCCARFYRQWLDDRPRGAPAEEDIIHRTLGNTARPSRLPFLLNDVFYFYSRRGGPEEAALRDEICRRNAELDLNVMNVIPWHPCSYRCRPSLDKASLIWKVLRRSLPGLAAALKACLARTVVFWDWHRFAVLRGSRPRRGGLVYDGLQPPFALLPGEIETALRQGDRLRRGPGGTLEAWRGRERLASWGSPAPLLLDFSASGG